MSVTARNWKNKKGTGNRNCRCLSWKNHWINNSGRSWPGICSVDKCLNAATLGAHLINSNYSGEIIVPMCDSCNKLDHEFDLKGGVQIVSANKLNTCS